MPGPASVLARRAVASPRLSVVATDSTTDRRFCQHRRVSSHLGSARPSLVRSTVAELVGSFLLLVAGTGSGIVASKAASDYGVLLLTTALTTGAAMAVLVLTLRPTSGSFNPLVSLALVMQRRIGVTEAAAHVVAQVVGAIAGVVVANGMFQEGLVTRSSVDRFQRYLELSEAVAAFAVVLAVLLALRTRRFEVVAAAAGLATVVVGVATSSTGFASPATTIGRVFTPSFVGIAHLSALAFIGAQLVGGALAVVVDRLRFGGADEPLSD